MFSRLAPVLVAFSLLAVLVFPQQASAQLFPGSDQGFLLDVGCVGTDCDLCHLVSLGQNVINFLVYITTFVAVILFVYAGFLMVTAGGDMGQISRARSIFTTVAIGFIIALAAWLIIDTVMKTLFNEGAYPGFGPWNQLECSEQPELYVREGADADDRAYGGGVTLPDPIPEGTLSHADARAILQEGGSIAIVSSGGCTDRSRRNCTSLDGVRPTTIDRIVALQQEVGEQIVVTGGTEVGHSTRSNISHQNGYKIDLRTTPALNNYIMTNYTSLGGNKYQDPHGNIYWRHGPNDHWDVSVTR